MNCIQASVAATMILLGTQIVSAQQTEAAASSARVAVSAPFAQQLIVKEKSLHAEIQKLGLHAVPPGDTQNVIIANNLPEKVGKVSSPGDMQLVASGAPQAVAKDGFWDTFVPVHDHTGAIIGFLVMEVPFQTAPSREGAIAKGVAIRGEVQAQAPTLEALFGPAIPASR